MAVVMLEAAPSMEHGPAAGDESAENLVLNALEAQWRRPAVEPVHERAKGAEAIGREKYAHSLTLLRRLGEIAAAGALETEEGRIVERAAREDFESSLVEMLQTDAEFRKYLEINRDRTFAMRGGKVINNEGEPMVDMLRRGAAVSARDARKDPRMRTQANRDAADVRNAEAVDTMPVGTLRITLAMDPKEAMARDGKDFWEDFGYRDGIAFIQWYYKADASTLLAGARSVDYSELARWRAAWAEFGGHIPEGELTDSWLDHAITMRCADGDEARSRILSMRSRYYQKHGLTPPNRTVDEFKAANQGVIDDAFRSLYIPLAVAHATGTNNGQMQEIAGRILQHPGSFKQEVIWALTGIRDSRGFDDDATRLMESIIRYGMAERMRLGIRAFDGSNSATVPVFVRLAGEAAAWQSIAAGIAGGVIDGVRAGRTYGGCTPSIKLTSELDGSKLFDPQNIFGGRAEEPRSETDGGKDGKIRCIKCREYVEKKEVVKKDCWQCPRCKHKVDVCTGETLVEGEPSRLRRVARSVGSLVFSGRRQKAEPAEPAKDKYLTAA